MNNTPDSWVIVKIKGSDATYYKILAGWSGGYLDGDSWKLNSGITKVDDEGDYYIIHGVSSSIYTCYKQSEGLRISIAGVYNQMVEQRGEDKVSIVDMVDIDEQWFLDV